MARGRKYGGKEAREGIANITKRCPNCGGGFIFTLEKRSPEREAVIESFIRMYRRGEIHILSVEQAEENLREGKNYIHPLAGAPREADSERTSAGVPWDEVPEHARHDVEWIDGRHGAATVTLPDLDTVPVPQALLELPRVHPDRPTGSKPMLDAAGAKARLAEARPGAWLISTFTGWKWAKWPGGEVGWLPKDVELPEVLRVGGRNYDA
jgi:hypothetical protein